MMDELVQRHREEQKQLTQTIIQLRKSVPKSDKKKKREVNQRIADLEYELRKKHQDEINELSGTPEEELDDGISLDRLNQLTVTEPTSSVTAPVTAPVTPKKKVNKARMRIEKRNAELERIRNEPSECEDMGQLELVAIQKMILPLNLRIKQITADGHCLYNAFADQLRLRYDDSITYKELRSLAASYMRQHPDDFIPFLYLEDGNFDQYCHNIEHTACWGGQLEILALAKSKQVPVDIVQMDGPIVKICDDEYPDKDIIKLAYHKHLFSLGAHYNSLVDI
ncbi:hypothetical protein BDB01DRAFT_811276 [Pilobolus umbonatus]|nr:hypothetical protein BDB01DRAFT_811276 [Pilobolus umbonatus]